MALDPTGLGTNSSKPLLVAQSRRAGMRRLPRSCAGLVLAASGLFLQGCSTVQGVEERHYRRDDAKLHTKAEYYAQVSLTAEREWKATPSEERVADDDVARTLASFKSAYPGDFVARWREARVATQLRGAQGSNTPLYTIAEFRAEHQNKWPEQWTRAKEAPCAECCAGLAQAECECDARRLACVWTRDSTTNATACVRAAR